MTVQFNSYPQYSFPYGTVLNYACKKGYTTIEGKSLKTCSESKTWLGKDLVCKGMHETSESSDNKIK
jgi:hypothetical protein